MLDRNQMNKMPLLSPLGCLPCEAERMMVCMNAAFVMSMGYFFYKYNQLFCRDKPDNSLISQENTRKTMMIIGIAGGTGSGKTTVVRKIIDQLPIGEVVVIPQDSYYKDSSDVPVDLRQNINFDHPDSIEWELLIHHIQQLKSGQEIRQPKYDYISCTRQPDTILVQPKKVIIVEGILVLTQLLLRNEMDLRIFVDADSDDRLIRVVRRDVIERGRTTEMVLERYEKVLKPMHLEFIEPTKHYADIIVPQGGNNTAAIDMLSQFIRTKLME